MIVSAHTELVCYMSGDYLPIMNQILEVEKENLEESFKNQVLKEIY
jgi:hypothetical protein